MLNFEDVSQSWLLLLEEDEMEEGEKMERKDRCLFQFPASSPIVLPVPCTLHSTNLWPNNHSTNGVGKVRRDLCLLAEVGPFSETMLCVSVSSPGCSVNTASLCIQPHKPHSLEYHMNLWG